LRHNCNLALYRKKIHYKSDPQKKLDATKSMLYNLIMTKIKTYVATIKLTFETLGSENPRIIAKDIANTYNCMRGLNLHSYGELKTLVEKPKRRVKS